MRIPARFAIIACLLVAAPGQAQSQTERSPDDPLNALLACRAETDPAARLACFDRETGTLETARASGDVVALSRKEVRETRRSLFGYSLPKLPFFRGDDSQDETPDEIEGVVASAGRAANSRWQIELADGAVWLTTEPDTRWATPKPGQKVTIRRAAMGSFLISVERSRSLRAMRIR